MLLLLLQLLLSLTKCNAELLLSETEAPKVDDYFDSYSKLGDTCLRDSDCVSIQNGVCDIIARKCVCHDNYPVEERGSVCYEASSLNHSCVIDVQCEYYTPNSHCTRFDVCQCEHGFSMHFKNNGTPTCDEDKPRSEPEVIVDFTLLGVLAGMAVMFIVMCIVLRMFSKARFQEQRTIFNSPRLLKISLARKSRESSDPERRGSRASVPSRQPSVYSGLNLPGRSPTGSHASGDHRSLTSRRSSVQSPMDERRALARNSDQVTVDIRGGREDIAPLRINQV